MSLTITDISKKYGISKATASRWIDLSQQGKYNLELDTSNNKVRILDNLHNHAQLFKLSEDSKRYKLTSTKKVKIDKEFYEIYNENEVAEIINRLQTKKDIPDKFIYKSEGANIWDRFYTQNEINPHWSIPSIVEEVLLQLVDNICYFTPNLKLNLIDLGPGNSLPVKKFLRALDSRSKINSYVGVDISPEMIEISKKNVTTWFPSIDYHEVVADLENANFASLFLELKDKDSCNLILHTGGTISNHTDQIKVLKNVRQSMNKDDLFVFSMTLDNLDTRVELVHMDTKEADKQDTFVPSLLGIDIEECSFRLSFDEKNERKIKILTLDKDYILEFIIGNKPVIVKLNKSDEIIVWQHYLTNVSDLTLKLVEQHLSPVLSMQDQTNKQIVVICKAF